jgi:hypothetical protein
MGDIKVCTILIRKPGRKRSLGRPRHRWEDKECILGK